MGERAGTERKLLLSAAEVGALLGVNRSTVWCWDSSGRIPRPVRIGSKCTRWRRAEIEAWIEAGAPARERWQMLKEDDHG